ncbi:hypothetical protein BC831DRAFT_474678 [Entophlyctis helioformis]|nr:hypothetical protein BC831DRAFT_474678 [Entophlyctis helioformis]
MSTGSSAWSEEQRHGRYSGYAEVAKPIEPIPGDMSLTELLHDSDYYIDWLTTFLDDLARELEPTHEEQSLRSWLAGCLAELCDNTYGARNVELSVFGSCATGVYLSDADIDVVVNVRTQDGRRVLWDLKSLLRNEPWIDSSSVRLISTARVPVIKLTTTARFGAIKMDITANMQSGNRSTQVAQGWFRDHPELMPLVLVVKLILQQEDMDEVFTGGLGGFSLVNMAVATVIRTKNCGLPHTISLGLLLLNFLGYYGRAFNYSRDAIAVNDTLCTIPRPDGPQRTTGRDSSDDGYDDDYDDGYDDGYDDSRDSRNNGRRDSGGQYRSYEDELDDDDNITLYIRDPSDFSNNVSRGSFRMGSIRRVFRDAYHRLLGDAQKIDIQEPRAGLDQVFRMDDLLSGKRAALIGVWDEIQQAMDDFESALGRDADISYAQVVHAMTRLHRRSSFSDSRGSNKRQRRHN